MKIVEFPAHSVKDIAGGLRRLADDIDGGKYLDAYNVVWIIDCGKARVEFGMLGHAAEPGAVVLLLMELAKQKLIRETEQSG